MKSQLTSAAIKSMYLLSAILHSVHLTQQQRWSLAILLSSKMLDTDDKKFLGLFKPEEESTFAIKKQREQLERKLRNPGKNMFEIALSLLEQYREWYDCELTHEQLEELYHQEEPVFSFSANIAEEKRFAEFNTNGTSVGVKYPVLAFALDQLIKDGYRDELQELYEEMDRPAIASLLVEHFAQQEDQLYLPDSSLFQKLLGDALRGKLKLSYDSLEYVTNGKGLSAMRVLYLHVIKIINKVLV